jgi:hypothetical protein
MLVGIEAQLTTNTKASTPLLTHDVYAAVAEAAAYMCCLNRLRKQLQRVIKSLSFRATS